MMKVKSGVFRDCNADVINWAGDGFSMVDE